MRDDAPYLLHWYLEQIANSRVTLLRPLRRSRRGYRTIQTGAELHPYSYPTYVLFLISCLSNPFIAFSRLSMSPDPGSPPVPNLSPGPYSNSKSYPDDGNLRHLPARDASRPIIHVPRSMVHPFLEAQHCPAPRYPLRRPHMRHSNMC